MRVLYLHGFASGPRSTKGLAFENHFAARGATVARSGSAGPRSTAEGRCAVTIERLDLRVPSLEHLRLSAMIEVVRTALGAERAPLDAGGENPSPRTPPNTNGAVLIGSSLGAATAAQVAATDARVTGLVLLAPAFQLAKRWRETLGAEWDAWKTTGWRAITDFTTGQPARVDFGFWEDAAAIDRTPPDVHAPTLILHGTRDDVVPIASSRAFAAGRDHIELVELDDTHELIASLPTLLARTETFLAKLDRISARR